MFGWLKNLFGSKQTIMVSIPVEGEFPSTAEMELRNQIVDELEEGGFGDCVGSGGGFNQMDFEFEVADAEAARETIRQVMEKTMPGREYRFSVE